MNKIKVCHIITKLELGGAQQNTLYTLSHLDKESFTTLLITGMGGVLDKDALSLVSTKVFFIPTLVREIAPLKDFLALLRITFILFKEKPDIVHTHSSKAGILGRIAALIARVPFIIHTFHGFGFHDFQIWPVRMTYILIERATAWISDKLIAVSKQNISKGLQNHVGTLDKYVLIRSGIDIAKYKNAKVDKNLKKKELGIKEDEKVITTIGPFKPQKNLLDFVKVANLVSGKFEKCTFLIVGDGEQRSKIEQLIAAHNLFDKIKLLGWRTDISEILHTSDIFAMTSLWEGLPRSCLEAMSCGLPVIANSIDGIREIVINNENGFTVEPYNIDKMAACILKLLNDQQLARMFGNNSLKLMDEQYDINYMVKQQEELYKDLVNLN